MEELVRAIWKRIYYTMQTILVLVLAGVAYEYFITGSISMF